MTSESDQPADLGLRPIKIWINPQWVRFIPSHRRWRWELHLLMNCLAWARLLALASLTHFVPSHLTLHTCPCRSFPTTMLRQSQFGLPNLRCSPNLQPEIFSQNGTGSVLYVIRRNEMRFLSVLGTHTHKKNQHLSDTQSWIWGLWGPWACPKGTTAPCLSGLPVESGFWSSSSTRYLVGVFFWLLWWEKSRHIFQYPFIFFVEFRRFYCPLETTSIVFFFNSVLRQPSQRQTLATLQPGSPAFIL